MRKRLVTAAMIVCVLAAGAGAASSGKPGDMYLELVSASRGATSFEQIAPYLSASLLKEMKGLPATARAEWFKGMKDTLNLTDVKFTSEKISGDTCVLEGSAKNAAGKASKGRVELVREKSGWKFSDHGWATPL